MCNRNTMNHEIYKTFNILPDEIIDKITKINLFEELLETTRCFDDYLNVSEYYSDYFEEICSFRTNGKTIYLTDFYKFDEDFYGPNEGRFY